MLIWRYSNTKCDELLRLRVSRPCHSEQSEKSLIHFEAPIRKSGSPRCFAPLNMTDERALQRNDCEDAFDAT
jgi:hypothetical protein